MLNFNEMTDKDFDEILESLELIAMTDEEIVNTQKRTLNPLTNTHSSKRTMQVMRPVTAQVTAWARHVLTTGDVSGEVNPPPFLLKFYILHKF